MPGSVAGMAQAAQQNLVHNPQVDTGPSVLDYIKGFISNVNDRYAGFMHGSNPSESIASLGGNVQAEQPGIQAQAYLNEQVAKPFAFAQAAISRPISTGLILANPDSKDSIMQAGWSSLPDAWHDAANVSIMQAYASTPMGDRPLNPFDTSGTSPWTGEQTGVFGGIDPTDPTVRAKAFESGSGKFVTGAGDAAISWFLDPTVVGGKIAKVGILASRGEKLLDDSERVQVQLQVDANKAVAGTGAAPISSSHIGDGLQDMFNNRLDQNYLRNHPLLRAGDDNGALASVMAGSKDFDEFATVYLAARRDPSAMIQLNLKAPAMADALERSRADLNNLIVSQYTIPKIDEATGEVTHDWSLSAEQIASHQRIIKDLVGRDQWLQRALGTADGTSGVYGTMTGRTFSPLAQVEEYRKARAIQRAGNTGGVLPSTAGYTTTTKYQPLGKGSAAVRVINWFGSDVPRGYVNVAGVGASDSIREVEATLREAKADPTTMRTWLDKYAGAATADQRQQVLHAMDHELGVQTFLNHLTARGLTPTPAAFKQVKENAEAWMKQYHVDRNASLEQYRQSDNYMYDDASHEWWKFQPLESYQSQLIPMTDYAELTKALEHMDDEGLALWAHKGLSSAQRGLGTISYMWKAGVLLRVGAVPKNVLESQMASFVHLSRLAGNPASGFAHFGGNRWEGVKAKVWNAKMDTPESLADAAGVLKMKPQDVHAALNGKVAELESLRAQQIRLMEQNVKAGRVEGGDAYYALAPEHGAQVAHADIQQGIVSAAGPKKRPYLWGQTREEYRTLSAKYDAGEPMTKKQVGRMRELHARAARSYLREQQAAGMEVVAKRDGTYQTVDNLNDLGDRELLPNKTDPAAFSPNPDVYLTQRYKTVTKNAPSPAATVGAVVGRRGFLPDPAATHLPTFDAVFESDRLRDLAASHAHISNLDEQIEGVRSDLATLAGSIVRPRRKVAGQEAITATDASGRTYSVAGADQGTAADIMRKNITSAHKNNLAMTAYDTERLQASAFGRTVRQTGGRTEYNPDNPLYYTAVADLINTKLRNSPLAHRLLNGENPADTSDWLRTTVEGQNSLRALNMFSRDPGEIDRFVLGLNHNLRAMLPSEALQRTVTTLDRDITAKEVQAHIGHRDDLVPVTSEQWATDPLADPSHWVNKTIDGLYDKMWTLPEDRLARWPLYNTVYRQSVNQDLKTWLPHLEKMSEHDANQIIKNVIEPAARRAGMKTVKRVIYSADRRTSPAEALRFLAPFYQVTANRFAYYGSQFLENPQNMARLFLLWNAIPTEKDSQGNDVVVMPEWMAKAASLGVLSRQLRFQKSYLNLISSGDPWYSPGAGPLVTAPLSHVLRDNPNPPQWLVTLADKSGILPHGYVGANDIDQFLPTWARRIEASRGPQWANTYTMLWGQQKALFDNGQRDTMPTNEEITSRTNQLWNFRIAAAFLSPAQPDVSADTLITPAINLHRQYVQKYGAQADAMFLQDHPEMYDYVVSVSSNPTGIDATKTAAEREDQNGELIASLEDKNMAGLITNLAGTSGGFDSSAYNWEYGRPVAPGSDTLIRGPRAGGGQAAIDQRVVSRGWLEYTQAAKMRDSLLLAGGYDSVNSKGAEWIKALFDVQKNKILQDTATVDMSNPNNPIQRNPWAEAFAKQDNLSYAGRANTLQQIVGDQTYYNANIDKQPWLAQAQQYLQLRSQMANMLNILSNAGGSGNLAAKENAWLSDLWDAQTKALRDSSPQWADIANRYFANDQVQVIPSGG